VSEAQRTLTPDEWLDLQKQAYQAHADTVGKVIFEIVERTAPKPETPGQRRESLRDYFAAHAGEPPPDFMRVLVGMGTFEPGLEWRIRWAWTYADAMLAAREEK
jgi:hypothetical protein